MNWPGNGDPSLGVSQQLAPFVDVNNNGIYEPYDGDYPCIKGDEASYQILNEDRQHQISGGEKIGAEIHMMIYQFHASNFIDSTTFIDVTVINKGQNSFNDFKTLFYIDPDIGNPEDDYIGSAPSKNLMYAYNGSNYDSGQSGSPGYGINPPTVGVVSLNKPMAFSGYFNRADLSPFSAMNDPSLPIEYWNYMNGKWRDGSDWTYGGYGYGGTSGTTQHMYDGNPYLGTGWTELNTGGNWGANTPSDRRFFIVSDGESFLPGDTLTYNYAIIANRQGDNIENVQGIINYADSVQQFFDNTTFSCIQQGTGITGIFEVPEINYLLNFKITRLDGEGNMDRPVDIDAQTEQNILDSISVENVGYQRGKGPIEARLTDTINNTVGHFVLKFNKYNDIDTANWTIYHYDTLGGVLIDTVNSASAINIGNEQLIPQWDLAIKVKQENYFCKNGDSSCAVYNKIAKPIEASLTFADENDKWLTGVINANGMAPINWITSGIFTGPSIPGDSIHNPECYNSSHYDYNNLFTHLVDGIVAPGRLARYNDCSLAPVVISNSIAPSSDALNTTNILDLTTVLHPSIDIVFTADTSKWTRSPVIELNTDDLTSVNGGKAGFLRQSQSVDKQGNPDGTGTGMGWFPGYAIDVETGRRLNIAFGENSSMTADNGADMLWNPTERLLDSNGNYVLGGQHVIYVYGGEKHGMPNYDQGAFIQQQLSTETLEGYKNVYGNLSWVVQPLLEAGKQLNSTEARLRVRINKEFKTRVLSNRNEGRPMFFWDAVPYDVLLSTSDLKLKTGKLNIYPNPTANQVNIVWEDLKVDDITIFSLQGKLMKRIPVNSSKGHKTIDINELSSGVYFINVGNSVRKLIVK